MSLSAVTICNMALIAVGADPITSLSEESREAIACNIIYGPYRDDLLDEHPWNFTVARSSELAADGTDPLFGYLYRYQLPADCAQVLQLYDADAESEYAWSVEEGRYLHTDQDDDVYVLYKKNESDPAMMSAMFIHVLSLKLAATLAVSIARNRNLATELTIAYERELAKAKLRNAREGSKTTKGEYEQVEGTWITEGR